jgi:hypothetical protein
VRLLSLFPIESECAVGVNAQGPEWDLLAKHIMKFGIDRILAGDHEKYDLRMAAQLIFAAFDILITIAEICGQYTDRDIKVMKGLATEIAYSITAYNGDIVVMCGSNPSGHNLTVYINCIVNSLLMRCAYFHLWPYERKPEPFRRNCSAMTYGDDLKSSVRSGYDWFNHLSFAQFLRERDMVFTMPDKESTPTPFMHDADADFLKRKNVFNKDTGLIHGALDEESIFKSLHTVLESKVVSLEDQAISNIDGALREWWQHGRDKYEMRREQMKEVAKIHELEKSCSMLTETYEDRLRYFRAKYCEDYDLEDDYVETVGFSAEDYIQQCGSDPSIEQVYEGFHMPSLVDHCRGSFYDMFYSWEYILGDLTLNFYLYLALWIMLIMNKIEFKWGFPKTGWIYFLVMQNLQWKFLAFWFFKLWFYTYFGPGVLRFAMFLMSPAMCGELRIPTWSEMGIVQRKKRTIMRTVKRRR